MDPGTNLKEFLKAKAQFELQQPQKNQFSIFMETAGIHLIILEQAKHQAMFSGTLRNKRIQCFPPSRAACSLWRGTSAPALLCTA